MPSLKLSYAQAFANALGYANTEAGGDGYEAYTLALFFSVFADKDKYDFAVFCENHLRKDALTEEGHAVLALWSAVPQYSRVPTSIFLAIERLLIAHGGK